MPKAYVMRFQATMEFASLEDAEKAAQSYEASGNAVVAEMIRDWVKLKPVMTYVAKEPERCPV